MASVAMDRMRERARAVRARAAIQRWNYRQRNLAAGVWFRLRRVLAGARAAYDLSEEDAERLIAEGYRLEPCGQAITPEKMILFVDETRLSTLRSPRPIPVGLGPDFLAARAVALMPFDKTHD